MRKMPPGNGGAVPNGSELGPPSRRASNARSCFRTVIRNGFARLCAGLNRREAFYVLSAFRVIVRGAESHSPHQWCRKPQSVVPSAAPTILAIPSEGARVRPMPSGRVGSSRMRSDTSASTTLGAAIYSSTASSWNGSLDGNLGKAKTFIISTASATTTARRTLSYGSRSNLQVRAFTNNSTVLLAGASSSERYLHAGMR